MAPNRLGRAWTPTAWTTLVVMLGLAVWMQRQPLLDVLAMGYGDEENSHIFLVPFVAGWLLWLRRSRLRYVRVRPSFVGPAVVLVGSVVSWLGFNFGIQVAWHAGAGLTLVGVLLSMTGLEPVRQFAPVFLVLVFALPVPGAVRQAIAIPLQSMAAAITHATLELFGVATTRTGNALVINGQQIAVGEACNGMRMVFAFGLVVYAFAFSVPLKTSTRLGLLGLSPLTALFCNVIRLVPTALIYGVGTIGGAEWFHNVTGWLMLPLALLMHIAMLRLFRWLELPVAQFRLAYS